MKKQCQAYAPEVLSRFADNELDDVLYRQIQAHTDGCNQCRQVIDGYRQVSQAASHAIASKVSTFDTGGLGTAVIERVAPQKSGGFKKVFDYFSLKLYLKVASVAAVMVLGLAYFQDTPLNMNMREFSELREPSAIVTSVDARSSVMIFETEKSKHTVIWFSET
ncbi:MAG: zf-HC2 domain-containing protein [Desulfobacteraceae bacterium]|nr:MAG: zf-HC2 domain-containing protein [Desulfobacteraceae bacterium]